MFTANLNFIFAVVLMSTFSCSDDVFLASSEEDLAESDSSEEDSGTDDTGNSSRVDAGDSDDDGDGLSNIVEEAFFIEPLVADTDQDGYSDGLEFAVNNGDPANGSDVPSALGQARILSTEELRLNEVDSDQDGLGNNVEADFGTNQDEPDSDFDGYSDAIELINGSSALDSDDRPSRNNPPMPDGVLRSGSGPADTDRDGLSDTRENLGGTNAGIADTDGDGFNDGIESIMGSNGSDPASVPNIVLP